MYTSGIAPAMERGMPSGTPTATRSSTTTRSAYPPPPTIPITRSPGCHRVTLAPTPSTTPANSSPGTSDSPGGGG